MERNKRYVRRNKSSYWLFEQVTTTLSVLEQKYITAECFA